MKAADFLKASVVLLLAVGGCSDDESKVDASPRIDGAARPDADPNRPDARRPDAQPGACVIAAASGTSDIHGHSLAIPVEPINNPVTSVFNSTGGDHSHAVLVSSAKLTELGQNCAVTVTSNDTHAHTWTITIP
jgi:hypothetical protein